MFRLAPGEVKTNTLGLTQAVQSCKGMVGFVEAVVLPPVPESLHWNPAGAASVAVANVKEGLRLFDNTAGANVICATGRLQEVVVALVQPGLYSDSSSPLKLPCTTKENSCGLYGGGVMRKAVTVMTTSPAPKLFQDT